MRGVGELCQLCESSHCRHDGAIAIRYNVYTEYDTRASRKRIPKMKNDIDGIIAKIAKIIETDGRDAIFVRFEHADSINFDIDGADAWFTVDSQSDTGDDGHWGSSAGLDIGYGSKQMELKINETVSDYAGDDDPRSGTAIHRAERIAYDKLIDEIFTLARRS